ncbi:hypothetical protein MOSE0_H09582 [Monosporozyma servazzii]
MIRSNVEGSKTVSKISIISSSIITLITLFLIIFVSDTFQFTTESSLIQVQIGWESLITWYSTIFFFDILMARSLMAHIFCNLLAFLMMFLVATSRYLK